MNYKYIDKITEKYTKKSSLPFMESGEKVKISYSIPEGEKERIQSYEGLIIAKNNRGLGKSITLRRSVQGIALEQVFSLASPKIVFIEKLQQSKTRRSKLYFLRFLKGKLSRLKRKF
jgi:large subunit ribosomal protein L19